MPSGFPSATDHGKKIIKIVPTVFPRHHSHTRARSYTPKHTSQQSITWKYYYTELHPNELSYNLQRNGLRLPLGQAFSPDRLQHEGKMPSSCPPPPDSLQITPAACNPCRHF